MKRWFLCIGIALLALGCSSTGEILQDFDGDGSLDADDCNPSDASIHPGADDGYGDGIDSNCDGVDGNAVDLDGDGYGHAVDCDDLDASIHPGAADEPGDGIDSNCDDLDGVAVDLDGDGYSTAFDCDDSDPTSYPGATDTEGDGVDQNCDGVDGVAPPGDDDDDSSGDDDDDSSGDDDDGAIDADGDGVPGSMDCDDGDPLNFPGNVEVCDGQDNDCSGWADFSGEGVNADGDGALACADCDDSDAAVHEGASEACDGVDTDCNGSADFDLAGEVDGDLDGVWSCADCDDGDATSTLVADDPDCDGFETAEDCDDTDPSVPGNGDVDCDGVVDCGSVVLQQGTDFVELCSGSFEMGCTATQQSDGNCSPNESPVHTVELTHRFWLGATEVTQGQWTGTAESFANSSWFGPNGSGTACGTNCPVEMVNWWETLAYANALSSAAGLGECYTLLGCGTAQPGNDMECSSATVNTVSDSVYDCEGYRLPTEAEWEYAARAGTDLLYAGSNAAGDVSWYINNSGNTAHPVATKDPNAWGLYDMSGNVFEWTWDIYDSGYYSSSPSADPEGPTSGASGDLRTNRGGGSMNVASDTRVAGRYGNAPGFRAAHLGFRLARTIP